MRGAGEGEGGDTVREVRPHERGRCDRLVPSTPSACTRHPATGSARDVTAAITVPSSSSPAVKSWSSRCRSNTTGCCAHSRASGSRNQVASESAFTARACWCARRRAELDRRVLREQVELPRKRTIGCAAGVARRGFDRTSSTRPTSASSARMRWLTADGVMRRRSAAASMLPASSTAARVAAPTAGMRTMKPFFSYGRI
jgi:hypothetical protein